MTPKHSIAVDPVFLHILDLLDRIAEGFDPDPKEEKIQIHALLDQGEAIVGSGEAWELTKYALVSWIDEVLVSSSWSQGEWWSNNVLEIEFFNTRLCNELFFVNAQKASQLNDRDALEVYYICVILGFRGLYQESSLTAMFAAQHNLPEDLASWTRQTAMAIRLGQGRPSLEGERREIAGAPPLSSKSQLVWPWLVAGMLLIWNVLFFIRFIYP